MLVAHLADFGEVFQFALFLFVLAGDRFLGGQLGKQVMRFDLLAFGKQAGVRAEHFDEGVDLGFGGFLEFDEVVALFGREKVVGMDGVELWCPHG